MKYVRLGRSGLQVSRLSLGAMGFGDPSWRPWVLRESDARPIFKRALDAGINLIDTCNHYSNGESEALLGRLLKGYLRRSELVIATKMGFSGSTLPNRRGYSRKTIFAAVDQSLKRLGVDYIDLIQTHIWDPGTNIEEMVEGLGDLVRSGKVLYVGAADMPAWQLAKAFYAAKAAGIPGFVSLQYHYNLIWREAERELMPFALEEGLGLLPYSPMARGFLSGTARLSGISQTERARTDDYTGTWYGRPNDRAIAETVSEIADRYGVSSSQVALAWVARQPGVHSPVFGATRVEHVDAAIAALDLVLDEDATKRMQELYQPRPRNGHN